MLISADVMRTLLLACILSMAVLAVFYLRRRQMSSEAYLGWGLLAVCLPLLGPFLVILMHPGRAKPLPSRRASPGRKESLKLRTLLRIRR